MPNISGEYTLAEAAAKLDVSPAWIGKVRQLTGVGGSLGVQGKKATFIDKDITELNEVKYLRIIGFDYKDIRHLYKLEEELLRLNSSIKKTDSKKGIGLSIHTEEIFDISKKTKEKDRAEFMRKFDEYYAIRKRIKEKMDKIEEHLKNKSSDFQITREWARLIG